MAKNGENVKKAAFETFTGKWAKENGFTEIFIARPKYDLTKDRVLIKFIKPK